MTFKIRSEATRTVWPNGLNQPGVNSTVLVREKVLHEGNTIRLKGVVATDVEAKSGIWIPASVRIRVIDDDRLGIVWQRTLWSRIYERISSEEGYWDPERIVPGETLPHGLSDSYHEVSSGMPEAFTLRDKLRLRKEKEKTGWLETRTELIYEPTLSPQARK